MQTFPFHYPRRLRFCGAATGKTGQLHVIPVLPHFGRASPKRSLNSIRASAVHWPSWSLGVARLRTMLSGNRATSFAHLHVSRGPTMRNEGEAWFARYHNEFRFRSPRIAGWSARSWLARPTIRIKIQLIRQIQPQHLRPPLAPTRRLVRLRAINLDARELS